MSTSRKRQKVMNRISDAGMLALAISPLVCAFALAFG
mgnify:CR=1 FL=1